MAQRTALQRLGALSAQLSGTRAPVSAAIIKKRWNSAEAGENKSGHIQTNNLQSVLFFSNLLPINLQWLFRIPWTLEKVFPRLLDRNRTSSISAVNPTEVLENAAKAKGLSGIKVLEVLPRLKEGGAFVKFSHDETTNSEAVS